MLARSPGGWQRPPWQRELVAAFTRPADLLAFLDLPPALAAAAPTRPFPFLVPRAFAERMTPGDPCDPLLRQVLPIAAEGLATPGFGIDPVGDGAARRAPGLLQKYAGRALLVTTGACAVHCRYCFRRHFPFGQDAALHDRCAAAVAALAADPTIAEVILSGGDPLMLDDAALGDLIARLAAIPHLRRLRLHTRLPVVLPSRVTPALCRLLADTRLRTVVVIHTNHPAELGERAVAALADLRDARLPLLNQSVLLRGVNDRVEVLQGLAEGLFDAGVLNYYLHLLDPVAGAAHFDVPEAEAAALIEQLRLRLPGYLVPRLVREVPGARAKLPVA